MHWCPSKQFTLCPLALIMLLMQQIMVVMWLRPSTNHWVSLLFNTLGYLAMPHNHSRIINNHYLMVHLSYCTQWLMAGRKHRRSTNQWYKFLGNILGHLAMAHSQLRMINNRHLMGHLSYYIQQLMHVIKYRPSTSYWYKFIGNILGHLAMAHSQLRMINNRHLMGHRSYYTPQLMHVITYRPSTSYLYKFIDNILGHLAIAHSQLRTINNHRLRGHLRGYTPQLIQHMQSLMILCSIHLLKQIHKYLDLWLVGRIHQSTPNIRYYLNHYIQHIQLLKLNTQILVEHLYYSILKFINMQSEHSMEIRAPLNHVKSDSLSPCLHYRSFRNGDIQFKKMRAHPNIDESCKWEWNKSWRRLDLLLGLYISNSNLDHQTDISSNQGHCNLML